MYYSPVERLLKYFLGQIDKQDYAMLSSVIAHGRFCSPHGWNSNTEGTTMEFTFMTTVPTLIAKVHGAYMGPIWGRRESL